MSARRRSETLPFSVLLAMDVLGWIFSVLPACVAWSAVGCFLSCARSSSWFWPAVVLAPAVAALVLILTTAVFRLFLPRLRPGLYAPGLNRIALSWFGHVCLSRAVRVSLLWPVIGSSHLLKFLYFRAMGARIAFGVNSALDITLVDLPLISIGQGCTLAEHCHLSAHVYVGNRLSLKPVVLGNNVFIGMNTYVGPGTELGEGTWVGAGNRISGETIAPGTKIPDASSIRPSGSS